MFLFRATLAALPTLVALAIKSGKCSKCRKCSSGKKIFLECGRATNEMHPAAISAYSVNPVPLQAPGEVAGGNGSVAVLLAEALVLGIQHLARHSPVSVRPVLHFIQERAH